MIRAHRGQGMLNSFDELRRPELERIRLREVRDQDNRMSLRGAGVRIHATRTQPPDESSGLVEMHRWFATLRK